MTGMKKLLCTARLLNQRMTKQTKNSPKKQQSLTIVYPRNPVLFDSQKKILYLHQQKQLQSSQYI